jgi:hypothetical protein
MKRNDFFTPLATRMAVITLALTAVLGTPAVARPAASRNVSRSAPAARRSAAPARANSARPAQSRQNTARPAATRQNAPRQTAASRPNTARPAQNAARPNAARPNGAQAKAPTKGAQTNTARTNNAKPAAAGQKTAQNNTAKPNAAGQKTAQNNTAKPNAAHPATAANKGHADPLHGGRQIPAARFNAGFGRGHQFHIGHPIMIGGQASFQFGGFWFGIVDPWPTAWLYTDAVYVDFIGGGYVLVNPVHPDVQIAVSVGDTATTCTTSVAVTSNLLARDNPIQSNEAVASL